MMVDASRAIVAAQQGPDERPRRVLAGERQHRPCMDKLLGALVSAWCWLRVAASPTLIGAALGAGAYYLIGGTSGVVAGGFLVMLGLYFGLRLANHARRKGQLVEFAHGLPPSKSTPIEGRSDRDEQLE